MTRECPHPLESVIVDESGTRLCALCDHEWWEDDL